MKDDIVPPVRGRAMVLLQVGVVAVLGGTLLLWNVAMKATTRPDSSGGNIKERGIGLRSNSSASISWIRPFLDETLPEKALEFVMSRKKEYDEAGMGMNWKLRGVGYLYTMKGMVLAAEVAAEGNAVHVYNVIPKSNATAPPRDDCDKFSLWVRVYGPEIFAGSPVAVPATETTDCYWTFGFEAIPGTYAVDAKALLWNSKGRNYEPEQACKTESKRGDVPRDFLEQMYPTHSGFKGFKLYWPTESCCEICNRLAPHCKFWTSPPAKLKESSYFNNGCEIYFDSTFPESEIPRSWIMGDITPTTNMKNPGPHRLLAADTVFGMPISGVDPQYFLGCGWSYWFTLDFPCLSGEKDDQIFLVNGTFEVSRATPASTASKEPLPLCTPTKERMGNSKGRWVQERDDCPPQEQDPDFSQRFPMYKHDGERPHCWNREDITQIGQLCVEMNCAFIDTSRYWNSRARVKDWYGVWKEKDCDYLEFTDKQLQQCMITKKITKIKVEGMSIAENLKVFVEQRLAPLNFYDNLTDPEAAEITVTTLSLLHHTMESETAVRGHFGGLRNATKRRKFYYMSGYFTSSEREPYTHMERMKSLNSLADEVLIPKGYKPLNAFDPSAAWTYDADGQRDGMHIVGPPVRATVTKLFHYICSDVVEGSRQ